MRARTWLCAVLLVTGVNCVAILDGEHPYSDSPPSIVDKGGPCIDDSNCQDRVPCSPGVCLPDEKICSYTLLDGVDAPAAAQIAADCQAIICEAGQPKVVPELLDVFNDNNSCTTDACVNGSSTNTPLGDGSACLVGNKSGICNASVCDVGCASNSDCDDGNPCSEDFCNTGSSKCVFTNLDGVPTPGATQTAGDCKVRFCEGGIDKDINDDADVFDDMNPCTEDLCTAGVPSNPPIGEGKSCASGETNVCDGKGLCVECIVPDHCVNIVETECEKRSCVNNKCQIAYQGQATLASPVLQTGKDCKKVVCSGMANPLTVTVNDNTDLPDDANSCTTDTCMNGVPTFTAKAQGTACGGTQVCNNSGQCIGCNTAADCMGTDDFCKQRTCTNNVCGFNYTANGTDLPTGQTVGDCKVLECDGMGNVKTSVLQSDVPVDGNQCTQDVCNAQGTPSNPPTAINSMCSVGVNDVCDGVGNCKKSLGKTCGGNSECVSTRCVDGVCCNTTCTTLCEACNVAGSVGTCTAVPKGQDDAGCSGPTQSCNGSNDCDDENGVACSGNGACLSNNCVDGVCCNTTCLGTCRACNVAGNVGSCTNIPVNTDPSNECAQQAASTCGDTGMCDGAGACQKHAAGTVCIAQSCTGTVQSNADTCNGTGICVDGGATDCEPYACGAQACKTSCATNADCMPGGFCSNTVCIPP